MSRVILVIVSDYKSLDLFFFLEWFFLWLGHWLFHRFLSIHKVPTLIIMVDH